MLRSIFPLLFLIPAALLAQDPGFRLLFDGKSLDGWHGDPRLWRVDHGEIVGSTEGAPIEANSFLIYREQFADFHLKLQAKLRNHNSGIQFRSREFPNWVVHGLQADMAQNNWWGSIYDEKGGRGVVVNGWKQKGETVVRPGDWNDYDIYCKGDLIRLRVNQLLTAETQDTSAKKGVIALQLHHGPAMEVRFRDIQIKPLD